MSEWDSFKKLEHSVAIVRKAAAAATTLMSFCHGAGDAEREAVRVLVTAQVLRPLARIANTVSQEMKTLGVSGSFEEWDIDTLQASTPCPRRYEDEDEYDFELDMICAALGDIDLAVEEDEGTVYERKLARMNLERAAEALNKRIELMARE